MFCIFQVELRRWLADDNSGVDEGLQALERALLLFITGIKASRRVPSSQREA